MNYTSLEGLLKTLKTELKIRGRQLAFVVDRELVLGFGRANFKWLDLSDLAQHLRRHKWFLLVVTVASLSVGLVGVFLLPVRYLAVAEVLPPNNELYVGLLRSRTIADTIIDRFDLQGKHNSKDMTGAREKLAEQTEIRQEKDGGISIQVEDSDKVRAKSIADAYTEELQNLTKQLVINDALQRLSFYEQQLKEAQSSLSPAELRLVRERNETGSLALQAKADTAALGDHNRQKHATAVHTIRYRLGLYKISARQYEETRLAEVEVANANRVRVVAARFTPYKPFFQRGLSVLLSGLCGLLVASFIVIVQRWKKWMAADPIRWAQLELLRKAMTHY